MVRAHYTVIDAGGTAKNHTKMGLFKYGISDKISPDDLHQYVQIP